MPRIFNRKIYENELIMPKRKYVICFCCLLFVCNLIAQTPFKQIPSTPNFNIENTYLHFPSGDSTALNEFFNFLDNYILKGEEAKFTILHMGGSHIQAGIFSNRMRSNLLSLCPNFISARGLIFPFSAAKTNNPISFKTTYTGKWDYAKNTQRDPKYPLGLAGMCISPEDSNATLKIAMRNNDSISFDFSTIRLLGYCDSNWIFPTLLYNDTILVNGVFDSLTSSYTFEVDQHIDSFMLVFNSIADTLWENFYLRGFVLDNHLSGLSYVDIGVNGASVPSYLRCEFLENDLKFIQPDLCIFSIGINDASGVDFDTAIFIDNYKQLITKIRTVVPNCQVLFTTNNDSYRRVSRRYQNNTNGLLAQQAFYSLATYYNTAVFDWFAYMGGLKSMADWEKQDLAKRDKVHFTTAGYNIWGDALYNAILEEYVKHLKKNR